MRNVVELKHSTYENSYVGYKKDILNFLRGQLKDYVECIPTSQFVYGSKSLDDTCFEDFDHEHMQIVNITSNVILDIEKHATEDTPLMVNSVLFEDMCWSNASIEEV